MALKLYLCITFIILSSIFHIRSCHGRYYHDYHRIVNKDKSKDEGKHWALLVAGSSGWYNYRHQADVCHAYQILHRNGVPDEQIVVMMYNDIANNKRNPYPGVVINHPKGSDVYKGVPTDYTGETVTPQNFLDILSGNKEAMQGIGSGKVIESGPNDYIFVNMVDHGAPGIFAFPSEMLHARSLIEKLQYMAKNNMFKEMVIYMESCESGSMFHNILPKNIKIYATTAANGRESSYACYYDAKRNTYLGDVYSVKWMEDSDQEDLSLETLQKQFQIVRKETNTSHVMEYGDILMSSEDLSEFQGNGETALHFYRSKLPKMPFDAIPIHNVTLEILRRSRDYNTWNLVLEEHERIQCQVKNIVERVSKSNSDSKQYLSHHRDLVNFDCYEVVASKYFHACHKPIIGNDGFNLKQLHVFVNMCQDSITVSAILAAIEDVCVTHSQDYCR